MAASLQSIYEVFDHQKTDLLLHLLSHDDHYGKSLVFVRSRESLQALTTALIHADLAADSISGNKKIELRDRALRELLAGDLRVIVATEAILRETDLTGIAEIIHFDLHELDQDYLSRVQSATKEVTTFVSQNDQQALKALEELLGSPLERRQAPGFDYDSQPRKIRGPIKKTHASNKTKSKPLQNKKPKLKNKGPRRKTGRTRKR
ncbi:MAG: ATP-dependent RNA helicase RhlE [Paracoccaceae bacterium]|jgi:ATP-dependent RNA helicase RhlE